MAPLGVGLAGLGMAGRRPVAVGATGSLQSDEAADELLGLAAPDAALLAGPDREGQARIAHRAGLADSDGLSLARFTCGYLARLRFPSAAPPRTALLKDIPSKAAPQHGDASQLWTSPRGPDTVAMRPGAMVAGGLVGAGVPIRRAAGSGWWSAAVVGCTRRSSERSRPALERGCGSGSGRPARP